MRVLLSLSLVCVFGALPVHARRIPAPCSDRVRISAGVRLALTALREADPAASAALDGCAAAVTCGREPTPSRTACTMQLMPEDWGYQVTVVPRAANGAPLEMRVNVDTRRDMAHQIMVSRNRWAVGRGVAIVGETQGHLHTHGGDAARINRASFHVWNDSGAALPLVVLDGVFINTGVERPLAGLNSLVTSLPPGESELMVSFDAQPAYQSWNDQFAARVRLRVGGEVLAPRAEFSVSRMEPLRDDDY